MTDTDGVCPACIAGDHDECAELVNPFDSCFCIDQEHDGDQFGETGSQNSRLQQVTETSL